MNSLIQIPNLNMVASGAGSRVLENAPEILEEAIELSGAEKPVVLTIGTAEPTQDWYDEFITLTQDRFGALGATVVNLHEFGQAPSEQEAIDKISNADTIWVAGGDTLHMVDFWKEHGIDHLLRSAAESGTVMSGGSAGMLSWMNQGHSDSMEYRVGKGEYWDYIFVPGLGYIDATACPHFDSLRADNSEPRKLDFIRKYMAKANNALPETAIGFDNMAALVISGGLYKVISAPDTKFPGGGIHVMKKTQKDLSIERLPVSKQLLPFEF